MPLDPTNLKKPKFFKVVTNAGFCVFEALNGPLGLILAPSWADQVPKRSPKWPSKWSKSGPKNGPKNCPLKSGILRRFWAPIWDRFGVKWPLKLNSAIAQDDSAGLRDPKNLLTTLHCRQNQVLAIKSLKNWSQNTNMKLFTNVKLSSKSCLNPHELQNLS